MKRQNKTKKRMLGILIVISLALFSGCGKQKEETQSEAQIQSESIHIGLSIDSFVIERWLRDRDMFVSTAKSLGADVNVQNANGSVEEQIAQIEYLIQKKMDVIVIIAIDGTALTDVIQKAKEEGIKVVCYDRLIENAGCDLYISFDNEKVGTLMAQALVNACPDGGYIFMINGSPTDHNVSQLEKGFMDVIDQSRLKVVYKEYCDNWLAELAFDYVNNGLKQEDDIVGIMCGNDDLAGWALKALSENRLAGKVAVVGQDAELSACQRIVEDTQEMTVFKMVESEASAAAILATALGKGTDITSSSCEIQVQDTIFDGKTDIPYYSIEPVAVTKENMDDTIIKSGFHLREDVYLNVSENLKETRSDKEKP